MYVSYRMRLHSRFLSVEGTYCHETADAPVVAGGRLRPGLRLRAELQEGSMDLPQLRDTLLDLPKPHFE